MSASRGRSRQGIGRRSSDQDRRGNKPGERAARRRHEPGVERQDGKPRHRQRRREEHDRDRAEQEAKEDVVAAQP